MIAGEQGAGHGGRRDEEVLKQEGVDEEDDCQGGQIGAQEVEE